MYISLVVSLYNTKLMLEWCLIKYVFLFYTYIPLLMYSQILNNIVILYNTTFYNDLSMF